MISLLVIYFNKLGWLVSGIGKTLIALIPTIALIIALIALIIIGQLFSPIKVYRQLYQNILANSK